MAHANLTVVIIIGSTIISSNSGFTLTAEYNIERQEYNQGQREQEYNQGQRGQEYNQGQRGQEYNQGQREQEYNQGQRGQEYNQLDREDRNIIRDIDDGI